jgi:hypothetical protein
LIRHGKGPIKATSSRRKSPARSIDGDAVSLASTVTERNGDSLNYRFTGTVSGEAMTGTLSLGEYLGAKWTARRSGSSRPAVSA